MSLSKHFPCSSNGLSEFSDDLIKEVLLRVGVKSLIRCKAVCKQWCSLIRSPYFVKSHLTITRSGDDETLIVHDIDNMKKATTTISLLHLGSRKLVADLKFPYSKDEFWFSPYSKIVGSANGIVCFVAYNDHPQERHRFVHTTNIYLWNPATKQSKLIPPQTILRPHNIGSYGFGFDPVDNDFKVVRSINYPFTTEVYSTNMNVWRVVGVGVGANKPYETIPLMGKSNVCVNGFLCWTGGELYDIMAFDLHKEVYNCDTKFPVVRPKKVDRFDNATTITTLNDTIAVIMWEKFSAKIDLWTLDNVECLRGCGVEASWTQMLSINADLSLPLKYVHTYFTNGDFLLTSSGDILERDDEIWFSYNCEKKKAKKVPFSVYWRQIFKYTESLVSIPGSKQVRWNAHRDAI